jgi:alkanesulfonate monooxygenase SsuD/methylene tetrahydromethanopterin reductase-like flavin-dependent oxidoreductase (luciferase family)
LYVGGGPAGFKRIARLKSGWISIGPSADAVSGQLEELRGVAGHDVPVIHIHMGEEPKAKDVEGYRDLGVEHVLVELPTEPRDQTLRRLDELQAEFAKLA